MRRPNILQVLTLVIFGATFSSTMVSAQRDAAVSAGSVKSEGIRSATVLTIHGKVIAVDKAEKLVTIQVSNGRKYTLKVANSHNLDAAKIGAGVVVRYYEVVNVRKKKPGESLPTLSVTNNVVTAKTGGQPGAVAEEHLNAVVTVVEVDKANETVTIKNADGSIETAKANDPKVLSHLKASDELVITTSRATAISLEKEPAK